jgi:phosphate transporter
LIRRIYNLEKSIYQSTDPGSHDPEGSPLLNSDDPDLTFRRALDVELERIGSFYQLKELELYGEVEALIKEHENFESDVDGQDFENYDGTAEGRAAGKSGRSHPGSILRNLGFGGRRRASTMSASINGGDEEAVSDDEGDESAALNGESLAQGKTRPWEMAPEQSIDDLRRTRELRTPRRRSSQTYDDHSDLKFSALFASGLTLKKRTVSLYVSLCELKSFIQLNKTGFSKALKKYDKILNRNLRPSYLKSRVTPAYPFRQSTIERLDENVSKIEKSYADLVTKGDIPLAKRELRLHLREHVVWERNTVWREMIGMERKAEATNMGFRRTLLGGDHNRSEVRLQGDEYDGLEMKELNTPVGRLTCPSWLLTSTFFFLVGIIAIFVVLLTVPIMKHPEQQNCFAMLVFVSLLWATEVSESR